MNAKCIITPLMLALAAGLLGAPERVAFQIECQEAGTVTATTQNGKTVFAIKGGRGIGRATVRRLGERWPPEIVLQAYLAGLESLTLANGQARLAAQVQSHGNHLQLLHLWKDGQEGPRLSPGDVGWVDIKILDVAGKPVKGLPPKGGRFELTLPPALLTNAPELKLEWIDFFRH